MSTRAHSVAASTRKHLRQLSIAAATWLLAAGAVFGQAETTALTRYSYDEAGNKTGQVDALGRSTAWTFDAKSRVTRRTIQDGSSESYTYDAVDNVLTRTTFAGEVFSFQYDAAHRRTGQIIPAGRGANSGVAGGSVVYGYSPTGQLLSRQEHGPTTLNGRQTFTYDANDQLTGTASPLGQITYGLDAMGNVLERSISGAGTVRYEYDDAQRLTKVIAPDGKQARYGYDSAGRLLWIERELNPKDGKPQSLKTSFGYDDADRVTSIANIRAIGTSRSFVAGQHITRGAGGAILRIDTERGDGSLSTGDELTARIDVIQSFEYDALARLTRELRTHAGGTTDTRYVYDAVGNRMRMSVTTASGTQVTTYTYDVADRLTRESVSLAGGGTRVVEYTYDGNGNLASKTEPGKVTLYRFDPRNKLIDIRVGATASGAQWAAPLVAYAYDADGNRVRKSGANAATYLVDIKEAFSQVAQESRGAETLTFVRGGVLLRQTKAGAAVEDHMPLYGHQWSSLGSVNSNGDVVELVDADAFGNLDLPQGPKQKHLYASEYWDQDAQLLYLRARWYDPETGRFISADPLEGVLGDPRSLNRYAYASSNPVENTDPTGEMTLGEVSTTLNTVSTLATAAADAVNLLRGDPDSDQIDGTPGLWDYLMAFSIRGLSASMGSQGGQNSDFRNFIGPIKGPPHHTIPVYTCGHLSQRMSTLLRSDHQLLHDELYRFTFGINFAGIVIDWVVYKRPTSRLVKTPLQRTGQKSIGRAAIAAGLGWYYARDGWLAKGRPSIGHNLALETPRFIGSHHSAPSCQRRR